MKKLRYKFNNDSGAALSEYAVAAAILIPVAIISAAFLFSFNSGSSNPQGAIVNRGENSITPARDLSPTRRALCTQNPEPCL